MENASRDNGRALRLPSQIQVILRFSFSWAVVIRKEPSFVPVALRAITARLPHVLGLTIYDITVDGFDLMFG